MAVTWRLLSPGLRGSLLSQSARPLRFAGTGGTAGAVQLLLLTLLTHRGWNGVPANGLAFLVAAQVNFVLSVIFTWRDRGVRGSLPHRLALFHASIGLMALANMAVFAVTRSFLPVAAASLAGIATGATGNYVMGDRLVFRDRSRTYRHPAKRSIDPHKSQPAA